MTRFLKAQTLEKRIYALMDRMGANHFQIESDRPHWRSGRSFSLKFDFSRGSDMPRDWRRVGYVQRDEWRYEGFEGALELLIADAEEDFEREIGRVAAERSTEARAARAVGPEGT